MRPRSSPIRGSPFDNTPGAATTITLAAVTADSTTITADSTTHTADGSQCSGDSSVAAAILRSSGKTTAVAVGAFIVHPAAPPPPAAERLLRWLLPVKVQDPLLGDLAEMYADAHAKHGEAEAWRLYWWLAIRSVAPVLRRAVLRWSVTASVAEWLWHRFGS